MERAKVDDMHLTLKAERKRTKKRIRAALLALFSCLEARIPQTLSETSNVLFCELDTGVRWLIIKPLAHLFICCLSCEDMEYVGLCKERFKEAMSALRESDVRSLNMDHLKYVLFWKEKLESATAKVLQDGLEAPRGQNVSNPQPIAGEEKNESTTLGYWFDLSGGQESVPVRCFVADDLGGYRSLQKDGNSSSQNSKPWEVFTYITKRVLDPSLGRHPGKKKTPCSCKTNHCSPESCIHVKIFDRENVGVEDIYGHPMKGRFAYDEKGCIIVKGGYIPMECNSGCHCEQTCQNRVLQKGLTVELEVFETLRKGWGVKAAQNIPTGTFVCEYVGEVISSREADKRDPRYLYNIDGHLYYDTSGKTDPLTKPSHVIDAMKYGNVSRLMNHSCSPNLTTYSILVDSADNELAHIGFFACKDIKIGEELVYDYRYSLSEGEGTPCHCEAPNCRGRLY